MAFTTLTLSDLIEETLSHLYRDSERPLSTTVGSNALTASTADVLLTVANALGIERSKRLEIGDEVMLVTNKTDDAIPTITVARGYTGTVPAVHSTGDTVLVDPPWQRADVRRWIETAFRSVMNRHLPNIEVQEYVRPADSFMVDLPADTMRVLAVEHGNEVTGRVNPIGGWKFHPRLPTSQSATGLGVRLPSVFTIYDTAIVTVQTPYTFSSPYESATIDVPLGAEHLPVLYAAAFGQMRREVSRAELDKIEEWNQEQAIRAGQNLRLVREMWGEFYRSLDEAKAMHIVPKHRPYVKMPKIY